LTAGGAGAMCVTGLGWASVLRHAVLAKSRMVAHMGMNARGTLEEPPDSGEAVMDSISCLIRRLNEVGRWPPAGSDSMKAGVLKG
jgi:hypothetical protein